MYVLTNNNELRKATVVLLTINFSSYSRTSSAGHLLLWFIQWVKDPGKPFQRHQMIGSTIVNCDSLLPIESMRV